MNFAAITPLNGARHSPQLLFSKAAWQGTLVFQGAVLDGDGIAMFLPLTQSPVIDELFIVVAPAEPDIALQHDLTHELGHMVSGAGAYITFTATCRRSGGLEQVLTAGFDAASGGGQWMLDKLVNQSAIGVLVLDPNTGELIEQRTTTIAPEERRHFEELRVQTLGQTPMGERQVVLAQQRHMERVMGKHPLSVEPLVVQKPGRNEPCPCQSGRKFKKCCGRE